MGRSPGLRKSVPRHRLRRWRVKARTLGTVESSRDEAAAPKPQAKDSPAVKVPKDDLDGLIELTANEASQRNRRRSPQAATSPTQTAADKLERLTTLSLTSREEIRRLPQPEAASRDVFAAWPTSGPAWVPADAGLVEILAGDIASHARQNSTAANAPSVLHGSSSPPGSRGLPLSSL